MKQLLLISLFVFIANISYSQESPDSTLLSVTNDAKYTVPQKQVNTNQLTYGEDLYVGGALLSFVGGGITLVSLQKESDVGVLFGGVTIAAGALVAIIGQHSMIIEERTRNKDAISISAASSGLGLAINF